MRLCHETSKGLDLPVGRSHRSVEADRRGCHLLPMGTHSPLLAGGFSTGDSQHLDMAGHRRFSGAPMSQGPGAYPARGSPSVLIQKGDWCGSERTRHRRHENTRRVSVQSTRFAAERTIAATPRCEQIDRAIDRGQLNGDNILARHHT